MTMNGTSINARNWGDRRHSGYLCCKMGNVGHGVAQIGREKGCLWCDLGQWLAKRKREGEPSDSARICEINYTVHSSENYYFTSLLSYLCLPTVTPLQ